MGMLFYYMLAIVNKVQVKYPSLQDFLWYHPVLGMRPSETFLVASSSSSTQRRLNKRGFY